MQTGPPLIDNSPPTRPRRARLKRALKPTFKLFFGVLIILAGSGALYETISGIRDAQRFPAPGNLYDIGGYRLHLNCTGEGSPTLILEAGIGRDSLDWSWVQPDLAQQTRVCSYDRSGSGWSDPGPLPRDSRTIAKELRALLKRADIEGPLVLVGHSAGGSHVQLFEHAYPGDVAAMVLVDVSHLKTQPPPPKVMVKIAEILHFFGVMRAFGLLDSSDLPAHIQPIANALVYRRSFISTLEAENLDAAESLHQVLEIGVEGSLDDTPLLILTAARPVEEEKRLPPGMTLDGAREERAQRQQRQQEMLSMSSKSRQILAHRSGHQIQKDQPELVIEAIGELVEEVRSSNI